MSTSSLPAALAEHAGECDQCGGQADALGELAEMLAASTIPLDCEQLSRNTLPFLSAALESNAAEALWRRIVTALVFAVAPLPLVLVCDAYLLRALHDLLQGFMPAPIATYVTFSYTALLALLLAGTYAVIPLSAGRLRAGHWGSEALGQ